MYVYRNGQHPPPIEFLRNACGPRKGAETTIGRPANCGRAPSAFQTRSRISVISSHDGAGNSDNAAYASPSDLRSASANPGNSGTVLHAGSANYGDAASNILCGNAPSAARRRSLDRRVAATWRPAGRRKAGQPRPAHGRRQEPQNRPPRWQRSFLSFAYLEAPSGAFPQPAKLPKITLHIQWFNCIISRQTRASAPKFSGDILTNLSTNLASSRNQTLFYIPGTCVRANTPRWPHRRRGGRPLRTDIRSAARWSWCAPECGLRRDRPGPSV